LSSLESTARAYKTEKVIEGHTVSPEWYLITITAQQYLFALKAYFDFVKSLHHSLLKKNIDQLIKDKYFLLAAQLTDCWIEFGNKLANCAFFLQKFVEDCDQLRLVKDLPWVDIDFDTEKSAIELGNKEAIDNLIHILPNLMHLQPSDRDLPDYFGKAYTFGVESCYQACRDNELERFKKIFPSVFFGALAAHDSNRQQMEGWTDQSQIIFSTEPIEDLLCLSGYAKLYGELHQSPGLWQVCEIVWNNYLAALNAKDFINFISATAKYRDSQYVLMPKGLLRTNWDTTFRAKLQELGIVRNYDGGHPRGLRSKSTHPSPLIRVVGIYGDTIGPNPRDIFFTTYLSQHPAAEDIDFPDKRNLQRQIQREITRQKDHPEDYEDKPD